MSTALCFFLYPPVADGRSVATIDNYHYTTCCNIMHHKMCAVHEKNVATNLH